MRRLPHDCGAPTRRWTSSNSVGVPPLSWKLNLVNAFSMLVAGLGTLVADLADLVKASGHVTGVDPSEAMLAVAADEVAARQLGNRVTLVPGDLSQLPVATGSADGVAIVQVLEHVDDVEGALREIHRVLRPDGSLVIVDTDWRSCVWNSSDRDRTDMVLRAWEDRFAHPHLPSRLDRLIRDAGFHLETTEAIPIVNIRTDRDTYSLGMVGAIAEFVGDAAGLGPEIADSWREDIRARADRDEYFFSLCRYLFKAKR